MELRFHSRLRPRQSAAVRDAGRAALAAHRGRLGACGRAVGEMTPAVGASHRLPCAARLGVVRRNSLRSLRELRSDRAPQVRSTKRASRADPEAALLGAADTSPTARPHASRRPRCAARAARPASRTAADCRSGSLGGVRIEAGAASRERRNGACKGADQGAGRAPRARLVRSREAQRHRRRAQRASSIILAAIVRAELAQRAQRVSPRQPVRRASQGTPAKRGQAPGAPAAPGPRPGPRLCSHGARQDDVHAAELT